jgi:hypothetical protein
MVTCPSSPAEPAVQGGDVGEADQLLGRGSPECRPVKHVQHPLAAVSAAGGPAGGNLRIRPRRGEVGGAERIGSGQVGQVIVHGQHVLGQLDPQTQDATIAVPARSRSGSTRPAGARTRTSDPATNGAG